MNNGRCLARCTCSGLRRDTGGGRLFGRMKESNQNTEQNNQKADNKNKIDCQRDNAFVCKVCHKYFLNSFYLTLHSRTHTGGKNFKCHLCSYTSSKNYLIKHLRDHEGKQPHNIYKVCMHIFSLNMVIKFQCHICHKSFAKKCYLKQHVQIHTGEQPYMVNIQTKTHNKGTSLVHNRIDRALE